MSERPAKTSDPTRQESQRTLAYGQDDRNWSRDDERLVSRARSFESQESKGRTCSSSWNHLVRTGMPWRCGGVPRDGHPYPISFSVIASTASPRCRSYYFPYEFISGSTNCFTENRGSNIPVTGNNIPFECRRRKII